jgi:flagellar biosynthetic protein FliR
VDIVDYTSGIFFKYIVVFARLGSAMMFLPGIGESQIPARVRLGFALLLCLALFPIIPLDHVTLNSPMQNITLLWTEITVGIWIGLSARIILSALELAGYQVGHASGLTNAFGSSVGSFQGATLVATFLMISAVALILITDTHHLMLSALLGSYTAFPPGELFLGSMVEGIVRTGSQSLYIGVAIAIPFFVMGVVLNVGMGLANKMMPQLPVFFVASSMLIGMGLILLAIAVPTMLTQFLNEFSRWFIGFKF